MNLKKPHKLPHTLVGKRTLILASFNLLTFQLWLGIHLCCRSALSRKEGGRRDSDGEVAWEKKSWSKLDKTSATQEQAGVAKKAQPDSEEQLTLRPFYKEKSAAQKMNDFQPQRSWNKPLGIGVTQHQKWKQIELRTTIKGTV